GLDRHLDPGTADAVGDVEAEAPGPRQGGDQPGRVGNAGPALAAGERLSRVEAWRIDERRKAGEAIEQRAATPVVPERIDGGRGRLAAGAELHSANRVEQALRCRPGRASSRHEGAAERDRTRCADRRPGD